MTAPTNIDERSSVGATSAIRATGLVKRFGHHAAVNSIDLDVPRGSVFGFLGPNGSGKTTTIRMLLGLIAPSAGQVELLGHPIPQDRRVLAKVGSLVEGPAFHPYLSGLDNLRRLDACDATADPATRSERLLEALERVGLRAAENKRFRQYSLGMKQRLGIAAALLQPRELLVLDEPTNGLDPQGTREVRHLVRAVAAEGMTVLISSHLLAEIEQVATHVGIMSAGHLLQQGPLEDVLGRAGRVVTVTTAHLDAAVRVLEALAITNISVDTFTGHVSGTLGDAAPELIGPALVEADVAFTGLAVVRPPLEEFFVTLTGAGFDVAG